MRLNPFSQGAGRRRAAMIHGDTPADDVPAAEAEERAEDTKPERDENVEPADSHQQFGFAYRGAPSSGDATAEADASPLPAYEVSGDKRQDLAAPKNLDGQKTDENGNHGKSEQPAPVTKAPSPGEPVVSTPHIERLRAQIGADAVDAVEPWVSDEPEAPTLPNATVPGHDAAGHDVKTPFPRFGRGQRPRLAHLRIGTGTRRTARIACRRWSHRIGCQPLRPYSTSIRTGRGGDRSDRGCRRHHRPHRRNPGIGNLGCAVRRHRRSGRTRRAHGRAGVDARPGVAGLRHREPPVARTASRQCPGGSGPSSKSRFLARSLMIEPAFNVAFPAIRPWMRR